MACDRWIWGDRLELNTPRAPVIQQLSTANAVAQHTEVTVFCAGSGVHRYLAHRSPQLAVCCVSNLRAQAKMYLHEGVLYSRNRRYLRRAALLSRGKRIWEAHSVDFLLASGERRRQIHREEQQLLRTVQGVVANSIGTMNAFKEHFSDLPPILSLDNATSVFSDLRGTGVAVVGTVPNYKGQRVLQEAFSKLPLKATWVGGPEPTNGGWISRPAVNPVDVSRVLSEFSVLVVPAVNTAFGGQFTSPMKLWDALATTSTIVAADTKALRNGLGDLAFYYDPSCSRSLITAIKGAQLCPPRRPFVRSHEQRARELFAFVSNL